MASFFDNLGKKITQASQGVAQSTRNFADTAKLNGMINDEERKIAELYQQIGRSYYMNRKEDPEEFAAGYVQEITAAMERMEQFKEQIRQIKGIRNCPNCGAEIGANAVFCNVCGYKLQEVPQQPAYGQPQQPVYGQPQQPPYGQPQQPPYSQPQQPAYSQPQQPEYIEPQEPNYIQPQETDLGQAETSEIITPRCANCGNELRPGQKFCNQCGTPVNQ